jgi:hypothetical protein
VDGRFEPPARQQQIWSAGLAKHIVEIRSVKRIRRAGMDDKIGSVGRRLPVVGDLDDDSA